MRSVLVLWAVAGVAAYGGAISLGSAVTGVPVPVSDLTGFETTANEMAGMLITGTFSTGANVSCIWAAQGGTSGSCTGTNGANGFNMFLTGDTFFETWSLNQITGGNLLSLVFDGLSDNVVFDRSSLTSTPGSSSGTDIFGTISRRNVNGVAVYSNAVGTLGNAPIGDLYALVTLNFTNGGMRPEDTASIVMDTDSIGPRGTAPDSSCVPEPGAYLLAGSGLAAIVALRRRGQS